MRRIHLDKIKYKIEDGMFLGSVYDNMMLKLKYNDEKLKFNYNVMMAQKHRMLYYKKLKKKLLSKCLQQREWENKEKVKNPNTIWICWMQGMDNAPILVQRCFESIMRNVPDKKIQLLDENNIFQFIDMPDFIIDKWKNGIIGPAHFADLVRLEILKKYGGYWIDATVLCTNGTLFNYLDNESLFMYSFYYFGFNPEIMELNNWFIYTTTYNNILCLTQALLYEYWLTYNRTVNYFVFQILMTIAIEYYEDELKAMPIISQVDSHILATYIYDEFDENKYELLKLSTGIHKLSTRFDMNIAEKKGTFYDEIIKNGNY